MIGSFWWPVTVVIPLSVWLGFWAFGIMTRFTRPRFQDQEMNEAWGRYPLFFTAPYACIGLGGGSAATVFLGVGFLVSSVVHGAWICAVASVVLIVVAWRMSQGLNPILHLEQGMERHLRAGQQMEAMSNAGELISIIRVLGEVHPNAFSDMGLASKLKDYMSVSMGVNPLRHS